ncbi:hypothetical protein N510_002743 [Firmicutes bacterium ASF500]|nr:hypothetical protein N510_002743 [Firmicutes bacterium ASF500]
MKTTLGRRWLSLLLTLVLCLGLSQAVWAEDPPEGAQVPEITLDPDTLALTVGETGTLAATVKENGTAVPNPAVTWKSDNEAIAAVANGTVTAVAAGTANITATYTYTVPDTTPDSGDSSGDSSSVTRAGEEKTVSAACAVTVSAAPTLTGLSVTLEPTSLSMFTGESQKLTATVKPAWSDNGTHDLGDVTYTWTSKNTSVATVDGTGGTVTVKPVSAGSTEIEVTASCGGTTAAAKCNVKVEERIEGLRLDKSGPFTMDVGKYEYIKATADPESAVVSWESKDEAVVEASSSDSKGREGILYARAPGKTEVTVSVGSPGNLKTRTIQVEVSGLVLDERRLEVKENETAGLPKLTVYGAAKNGKVVWQSADPNVAQISGNSVAGRGPGTTTITASVSGSYQVSVTVTVSADKETTIGPLDMKVSDRLNFGDSLVEEIRDQASERKLSHVTGMFVSPSQGTLYYKYTSPDEPNAGVAQRENYYYAPSSGQKALGDITFVPNPQFSGTQAVISYTVVSTTNQTSSGRILINLEKDSKAVINLGTSNSTPVFFSGNLFNRQCQQKTGSTLDYVIFSLPPANKGTLYFGYVDANNYGGTVTAGAMYRLAQLDSIVFVPAEGVPRDGKSETVTVYYTARSMAGGSVSSYAGQVDINVTRENTGHGTDVYYSISKGATKTLDDTDFTDFYGDEVLSYIRFDSLPASREGVLYHGYRSASNVGTAVKTDTNYYSGTRNPRLDRITFVPAEDFTGSVYIPFTGWDQNGNRFPGTLEINVKGGGDGYGDILYSCAPGRTVNFAEKDFRELCDDLTDKTLSYIILQDLPDRSLEGSIYHKSTRVSSAGTRYNNGSGTYRISNLSFRAVSDFSGTVEIPFVGYTTGTSSTSTTFNGVIIIEATGGSYGDTTISYYTDYDSAAVFDRDDFDEISLNETGEKVKSVKFSIPTASRGDLYQNYRSSSSKGSKITSKNTSISASSLDRVAFIPASAYTGTVYIEYTATAQSDGGTFEGTIEIEVERPSAAVTVRYGTKADPVDFDAEDFRRSGYTLRSVKFTTLPTSSEGKLYYQYTSPSQYTRLASTSTSYNVSGSNKIADLTFVPRAGYTGTVVLPYTGTNSSGSTFSGEVIITVSPVIAHSFTDLGGYSDQQRAAVSYIYDRGITAGMSSTEYGPELPIRRGDFARMIYIAFGFSPSGGSWVFNDVPPNEYYAQAVNTLYARGVVSGVGNGDFSPSANVSRQDAICMIQRALRAVGQSAPDGAYSALSSYSDAGYVSDYAKGAMALAVQRGYLPTSGNYLKPGDPLTRIDMADILHRVLTY